MILAPLLAATLLSAAPCTYGKLPARCGAMRVAEDRNAAGGRTIDVHYVVVPAKIKPAREPLFLVAGGPGQSAIDTFEDFITGDTFIAGARRDRDIVVVDQRGTGKSHPLTCNFYPTAASTYRYDFPPDTVTACRSRLAADADLNAYGSDNASDDLNDLRSLLGYKKIVLVGGSYGTTESLVYLRRHNDTVAGEVLEGVAPPWMLVPKPFPKGAQFALDQLERSCASDKTCSTHFPHFAAEFDKLVAQSKAGGIPVKGGAISFEVFADRMRQTMYDSEGASFLPLIVHEAATGNTEPLRKLVVLVSQSIPGSLAMGMNMSIDCSEWMPFITDADAKAASAGTFMGDSRYRAQRAGCNIWNVRPVSRSYLDPIRSGVPVLMINGEEDPAAPPQFGKEALRYLPNGRQILIPNTGHDFLSPCTSNIELEFLKSYSVRDLNTSCVRATARPPFATSLKGLF